MLLILLFRSHSPLSIKIVSGTAKEEDECPTTHRSMIANLDTKRTRERMLVTDNSVSRKQGSADRKEEREREYLNLRLLDGSSARLLPGVIHSDQFMDKYKL